MKLNIFQSIFLSASLLMSQSIVVLKKTLDKNDIYGSVGVNFLISSKNQDAPEPGTIFIHATDPMHKLTDRVKAHYTQIDLLDEIAFKFNKFNVYEPLMIFDQNHIDKIPFKVPNVNFIVDGYNALT